LILIPIQQILEKEKKWRKMGRGKLVQLELENFKSYAGKQTVGPFSDFTCIIGPNGAGKSNMMDAISFVLGVQSRALRASNLANLIFKRDTGTAAARRASVTLIYEYGDADDEEVDPGTEVSFSRSVASTGVSTYRIDRKEVTYEEYERKLESIGVLVKARNFLVFQGDVESVASKSPADLCKFLEQICGSDQLKQEYDNALKEKIEVEENIRTMQQKNKMFKNQKREAKAQKDEADAYQESLASLGASKTDLVMWQIWRIVRGMEEHAASCQLLRDQLEAASSRVEQLDAEIEAEKQRAAKVNKSFTEKEKEYKKKKHAMEAIAPQVEVIEIKLKNLRKRAGEIEKNENSLRADKVAQERTVKEVLSEITAIESEESASQSAMERLASSSVQLDAHKLEEYSRLRQEVANQAASVKAELDTLNTELASKRSQLQRIENQNSSTNKEFASEQRLISDYTERATKLRHLMDLNTADISKLQRERSNLNDEMTSNVALLRNQERELAETVSRLSDFGDARRRTKQEERMVEAIAAMQAIFPGVHGKLADLCQPIQKKYSTAISVAAGRKMDAIVVDKKDVIMDCIQYLKQNHVGSCIFIPLDFIQYNPVPERLRNLGAKYRPCVDLIACDEKYKPAIAYAIEAAIVCDSLEDARDLAFNRNERVKIVTTGGQVIGTSGAMTGGYVPKEGATDRWEEKEADSLKSRKAELESSIAQLRQQTSNRHLLTDYEMQIKTLQSRIQFNQADLAAVEEKLAQINQQVELKRGLLAAKDKEKQELSSAIAGLEERIESLQHRLRDVEARVFKNFSESVGVTNIREFEENSLKRHQELRAKMKKLSERRAALEAQLEYERKRDFDRLLKQYQGQLTDIARDIALSETEKKALESEEKAMRKAVQSATKELEVVTATKDELRSSMKKIHLRQADVIEEKDSLAKKVSAKEILAERFRSQLHDVLQRALVEEISLPVVDSTSQSGSSKATNSNKRNSGSSGISSSSSSDADSLDESLRWTGSQTRRGMAEDNEGLSSSDESSREKSSATDSAHFSQSDNEVVERYRRTISVPSFPYLLFNYLQRSH
jgi:structural maintenance of chromosome 1